MWMMELDGTAHHTTMLRRTIELLQRNDELGFCAIVSPHLGIIFDPSPQPLRTTLGASDMATRSETKLYMDINPAEFGPEYEKLVKQERELYEAQKLIRKAQADYLNSKTSLGDGYTVISTTWTRWGQHQAVCDKASAKPAAKASTRPSLSEYLKAQRNTNASH